MADAHRSAHARQVYPLECKRDDLMREMVHLLDARLHQPGLSRTQQRQARDILCSLAASFAEDGDEAMRALHDAHGEQSFEECQRLQAQATQELLEDVLGQTFDDGDDFRDPEAVLRAGMERMQRAAHAAQAAREASPSRRARRARPSKAQAQAQDADTALRTIFRQLASALHPDRETDPAERARKNALMSEANAAYGRRDLLALLQLQLRADLADGPAVARLAQEKLAALTALLKERADRMQYELFDAERQLRIEFALGPAGALSELALRRHIAAQKLALRDDIEQMQRDLRTVRDDAAFKRWLREQTRLAREPF
ncbi:MAG: hypothetical protein IT480_01890 [Gammaproteobacteria bacterium]|nr:hypothetical protein [Gammaproteobacteria bacterium]